MCYYSVSLRRDQFRDAKEGEDLSIVEYRGHSMAHSKHDHKIVCIRHGAEFHTDKLVIAKQHERAFRAHFPKLEKYIGQPVSGRFTEGRGEYTHDSMIIDGQAMSLGYLGEGMSFYLGPKAIDLETKLGVDDPSIALDHRETVVDETPTFGRTLTRALGLCSIIR